MNFVISLFIEICNFSKSDGHRWSRKCNAICYQLMGNGLENLLTYDSSYQSYDRIVPPLDACLFDYQQDPESITVLANFYPKLAPPIKQIFWVLYSLV